MEKRFMLGDSFDALAIRSYLDVIGLLGDVQFSKRKNGDRIEKYILRKNGGDISIVYNPYFDTTQVIMSNITNKNIINSLEEVGRISREKRNLERYGVAIN